MGGNTAAQKTRAAKTTERGTRVKQQSQSAESALPAEHPEQYLCTDCVRLGQGTTGGTGIE